MLAVLVLLMHFSGLGKCVPPKLGGPGCVVQIDELLFRHKPKVQ